MSTKLTKEEKRVLKEERKEEKNYYHQKGDVCPLTHLKVNQIGKLINFTSDNKALRRRLLDMGLTKGCNIKIKQISPLGDPVNITLRGYDLCIRKNDMKNILVEVVE